MTEEPLLEVTDLHTGFRLPAGLVKAVDGVSLRLDRGRTLGVVGESGSGKTVLSRSIMGLIRGRNVEQSGSVVFEGREILGAPTDELRPLWGTEMAMVFQDPMTALNPVVKIGRQITEGLQYHLDMSRQEATEAAIAGLRAVGIPGPERRIRSYPHELSGGMRQRVVIAIALACGPKLLFADEPTTALDVTVQAQILDLLQQEQNERFMGMILVTHDLGVVAGRADEIIVMYAGQVVEQATSTGLFGRVRMPYTEALLNSVPRLADPSHTRLKAIGGRPPDLISPPPGCRFAPRCPYAQDKCRSEMPPLAADDADPGHLYRCWFPVEVAFSEGAAAAASEAPVPAPASAGGND